MKIKMYGSKIIHIVILIIPSSINSRILERTDDERIFLAGAEL